MAKSTAFAIGSFHPTPSDVVYQGDATERGEILSLTNIDGNSYPEPQSVGRVMYSNPVQLWEPGKQAIFETTITFKIDSKGNGAPADGIAFFIAPVGTEIPPGSTGGNLGIFDARGQSPNVFAVEFDSNVNYWDPHSPHIGININSRESKASTNFEDFLGKEVTATITYGDKTVTVVAFTSTRTFRVSCGMDLSGVLPQQVQVGVSGSTGDNVQYNYLRYWSFTSALMRHT